MTKLHNQTHLLANLPQEKKIKMLLTGLGSVRIVKNCDRGLGLRPRTEFSRPRSQFFTIRTSQPTNNIYEYGQAARYHPCAAWSQCGFRQSRSWYSAQKVVAKAWFEWHYPWLVSIWAFPASLCTKFYVSAFFDVVRKHPPTVHCYADDTQL